MKIYTVSVFTDSSDEYGYEGNFRCLGYYSTFESADGAVKINYCDMHEYTYDYAIIEEVEEGIYNYVGKRWLYKYNDETGEFDPINEPEYFKHFCNFSIG